LIGAAVPTTGAPAFVSLGVVNGTVDFNTSGPKPVPRFTAGTRRVGAGPSTTIDFVPATGFDVQRSDWVLQIDGNPDSFGTGVVTSFFVQLPWQFIENPGRMRLSARLSIGGRVAADETVNTPLDLPLRHLQVPEDAATNGTPLTFFGLRNLYTRSNAHTLPRVPSANQAFNVILHSSFTDFCTQSTSATVAAVITGVADILQDAGFQVVNFLQGQPAVTDCNLHWKSVGGHFMGRRITDPNPSGKPPQDLLENRLSAAIGNNNIGTVSIPSGMEEVIPFFDFYIFAESADPPNATELAHSETTISSLLNPTAATKAGITPIVIAKGFNSGSPLRRLLSQIATTDHANVLATTICHEIGHTFGLRHAVAFRGQPPYVAGDAAFQRGTMGSAGFVVGSGTPRMPLGFFGPVHLQEISRLFL
jgi:hypothetical protein